VFGCCCNCVQAGDPGSCACDPVETSKTRNATRDKNETLIGREDYRHSFMARQRIRGRFPAWRDFDPTGGSGSYHAIVKRQQGLKLVSPKNTS